MTGLGWMYDGDLPLLSLTFARGLTAGQLLERMGADPATIAGRDREAFYADFGDIVFDDDANVVSAGRCGQWAWVWEHAGWLCVEDGDLVRNASIGTAALVLNANEKPMVEFGYAEDGRLVTAFNTILGLAPRDRTGSDPHRFDAELLALGADPDRDETGPLGLRGLFLGLAESLGVGIPGDLHGAETLSARLRPRQ
ncbi:DUF6461 domain-containing protein [Streptacidiphilus sp. P02-A3a]|uniref:DUF6461 domain-containing protein n=1 Tax=Streptacidiphilus sp. P02-A3a TaxID=2704468 RepID=UPI0015F7D004|nr:DUF6461 domain-containing protein [Streptacidiphilus sp. P02-A3a]QMU73425.1 hypothetical protein GXP74_39585 [Streptacidiphilus sp. P02-A3a]